MAGRVKYMGRFMSHEQVRQLKNVVPNKIKEEAYSASLNNVKLEEPVVDDISIENEIKSLRDAFEGKFGQPVANRYKNDAEWISTKLNS